MAIVGNGPLPVAGSHTSTSSGTPSKLGTRAASLAVAHSRAPELGAQAWPNGAGGAASAPGASAASSATTRTAGAERMSIAATYCARDAG